MEETIKVQEEFEKLLEQLQRLKTINEITSANAISTDKVIKEIDKFVVSVDKLKNKYDDDLTNKSQSIGEIISNLKKTIQSNEEERKLISKNIGNLLNGFTDKTQINLSALAVDLKDKTDLLLKRIADIDKNLTEIQGKHHELLLQRFGEHESSLSISYSQNYEALKSDVLELENILSKTADGRKKELEKSISKLYESISNEVNEKEKSLLIRIESQHKELKLIKVFQIVTVIAILIGILLLIK